MSEPVLLQRIEFFKGTVDELVTWCLQRDLYPAEVELTGAHLRFQSAQTPEEAERRARYQAETVRRHEEWELNTYRRLREKFGDQP